MKDKLERLTYSLSTGIFGFLGPLVMIGSNGKSGGGLCLLDQL